MGHESAPNLAIVYNLAKSLVVENYTKDSVLLPKIPATHMKNIKNITEYSVNYIDTFRACIFVKVGIKATSYNLPSLSIIQHKFKKCLE